MKLKEFVHACNNKAAHENVEISVNIFKSDFATEKNKFSVIIQPD